MQLEIGKVYEGVVKGIMPYGAFVEIDNSVTGMVHISEVANTYVNDIKEHLTENQTVKVKVLSINEAGKISLSIKKAVRVRAERIIHARMFGSRKNRSRCRSFPLRI